MARQINSRDLAPVLSAAKNWIGSCLIGDGSLFSDGPRWSLANVCEVYDAFVGHPDFSDADFMSKLKGQLGNASPPAQQLMAEMLWALLLFPSNIRARTKRRQILELWALSGLALSESHPSLSDGVLSGIGSGGTGFNNYRPDELAFLIELNRSLKQKPSQEREKILTDYDGFMNWIATVHQKGHRQYRHMLRYFAFPDRVERMSSNRDRWKILHAFGITAPLDSTSPDRLLDDALITLRTSLQTSYPSVILDFYEPPLKEKWSADQKVKTPQGPLTVSIPTDDDEIEVEENDSSTLVTKQPEVRHSLQVQAKLAEIGAIMGFLIWIPASDRVKVSEQMAENYRKALLETLPLNYDATTLGTIEQIDVIWLKRTSIIRAFEVEHTTSIYSGLLRMADLLALQPNMDIRLHIVAAEERREKAFREMTRPVFMLLEKGPLSGSCSFLSYESVDEIRNIDHLPYMSDGLIAEFEEHAKAGGA